MSKLETYTNQSKELDKIFPKDANVYTLQKNVLHLLLEYSLNTNFGKKYKFGEILNYEYFEEVFAEKVPLFTYKKLSQNWWKNLYRGKNNVTWPGDPLFFIHKKIKVENFRIPVTRETLDALRISGLKQIGAFANFDLPDDFYEKEILISENTSLKHKFSRQINGLSDYILPFWFTEIFSANDELVSGNSEIEKQTDEIARKARNVDVGVIMGNPTWINSLVSKVLEFQRVKNIHSVWPNLRLVVFTSNANNNTRQPELGKIQPLHILHAGLTPEGFLAIQEKPETDVLKMITDNGVYFEFIPFNTGYFNDDGSVMKEAPVFNISEVQNEEEYVLLVSTVSGIWRCITGDKIVFTDIEKAEFKFTGRIDHLLEEGFSVSSAHNKKALQNCEDIYSIKISGYKLSEIKSSGGNYQKWYLATNTFLSKPQLAKTLDKNLRSISPEYRQARESGLKQLVVDTVSPKCFKSWKESRTNEKYSLTNEKILTTDEFEQWEKYVENWRQKVH